MRKLHWILVVLLMSGSLLGQAWKNQRTYYGLGAPAANMCGNNADLGILYTNGNAGGKSYTCNRASNGSYGWVEVGTAAGAMTYPVAGIPVSVSGTSWRGTPAASTDLSDSASIQPPSGGAVGGASTLTTVNVVPKVTSSGVLGNSKLSIVGGVATVYDDTAVTGVSTLVVRAGAGQASTNLQEWKNAAGAVLAYVTSAGYFASPTYTIGNGVGGFWDSGSLQFPVASSLLWSATSNATSTKDLGIFRTSAGVLEINTGTAGAYNTSLNAGGATFYNNTATTGSTTLTVRAGAGQGSANLQEWKSAAGVVSANMTADGTMYGVTFAGQFVGGVTSQLSQYSLNFGSAIPINWSSTTSYSGAADLSLSRTSAGRAQFNNGTSGKWSGLDVGSLTVNALATPGAPTVTPSCGSGACASTWTYVCVAKAGDGTTTVVGAAASTAANDATLDATHYNTVTCPAVTGASYQNVRRTVSGGTPATLGSLAGCTGNAYGTACVDNGLVGDASAAPGSNTTGMLNSTLRCTGGTNANCYIYGDSGSHLFLWNNASGIRFGLGTDTGGNFNIKDEVFGGTRFSIDYNILTSMKFTATGVGIGTTSPDRLLHAELADAGTNAVSYVSRNSHITSGTATTGFGAGSEVELENASGTNRVASTVETSWTDAVDATEDSKWVVKTRVAGSDTLVEGLKVTGPDVNITGSVIVGGAVYVTTQSYLGYTSGTNYVALSAGGLAKFSASPGGTVPAWGAYTVLKIANGVNGCTNANGCWQVNGARVADAAASPAQNVPIIPTTVANMSVSDVRIKTAVACVNAAGTLNLTDVGLTGTAGFYATGLTYDMEAAVSDTNLLYPTLAARGNNTAAATGLTATVTAGTGNVDGVTDGCSFIVNLLWGIVQ